MRPLVILKRFRLMMAVTMRIAALAVVGQALVMLAIGPSISEPNPPQQENATHMACYDCTLNHGCFAWKSEGGEVISGHFRRGDTICPGNGFWNVSGEAGWRKRKPRP